MCARAVACVRVSELFSYHNLSVANYIPANTLLDKILKDFYSRNYLIRKWDQNSSKIFSQIILETLKS